MDDTRNVIDEFKGMPHDDIVSQLDENGVTLEIAIENLERDFNMGTIVRSANAFGVRRVHVVGRRQWNKRGAMATDKYLEVIYHTSIDDFCESISGKRLVAIDNVPGSVAMQASELPPNAVLLFGAEGPGLSEEILAKAEQIIAIEQLGSTRSINVGVAAGIAMYEWLRRNKLNDTICS